MKKTTAPSEAQPALGIIVTPRKTYGMLLRPDSGQRPEVMRRFTRIRAQYASVQTAAPSLSGDGSAGAFEDATLTIGDAPASDQLFLASEFGDLAAGAQAAPGAAAAPAGHTSELFTSELQDLLAECQEGLGVEPVIGLVIDASDVQYAEVRVPEVVGEKADKLRARMMGLLGEQITDFDADRVVFLPMTAAEDGTARHLAVAPRPDDASTRTLRELRQLYRGLPPARLLDSEVSLLAGLTRMVETKLRAEEPEAVAAGCTLVVRPGTDDTLVLAFQEGVLHHYAQLRSLTAFDAPETLCSRILLQQDEHGLGDISRILVLSEANEDGLVQYLSLYYPDADVRSCRQDLAVEMLSSSADPVEVPFVAAYAVALRLTGRPADRAFFPDLNLLPPTLLRRRVVVPFSWHVYALAVLLFVTVFFFTARYVVQQGSISDQRARVAVLAPERAQAQVTTLQAEIDSLQNLTMGYHRSLEVIDSLLIGSDRWSRALEQVTRVASSVRGIWVESWNDGGTTLTLSGNATGRDRIVRFADMIGGEITTVSFSEIREFPVYAFTITIPLSNELPAAARYLRDQVAAPDSLTARAPVIAP